MNSLSTVSLINLKASWQSLHILKFYIILVVTSLGMLINLNAEAIFWLCMPPFCSLASCSKSTSTKPVPPPM
uniref:Uncharacterized protein n=1 Tax=Rhizophora mucronata TaxID=61149 RepID=A0A2P2N312_RHIMU